MKKFPFIVISVVFICVCGRVLLQEYSRDELLKKKAQIERDIELTNRLIEDTRNKRSSSLSELKLLRSRLQQRNKLIKQLSREVEAINSEIEENTITLQSYQKDLEKVKKEYGSLIYHSFKNKNANLNLMYLLASDNINQFHRRIKYLQQYKEYREKQIKLINRLNEIIRIKLIELSLQKQEKIKVLNKQLTERATIQNEREEANRIIGVLSSKEESLKKELDEKKRIAGQLESEIEKLIRKEAEKNRFGKLTPADRIISTDFSKNRGRLPWPTEQGVVTEEFGEHRHAVIKNLTIRNGGIDISSVPNSKVRAIFRGTVSKIFTIKGANPTVIIRHGNYYSVYHNIVNVKVKVGDIVETKEYIGDIFTDGRDGETVLHFEIWEELEKQNPEDWLSN